MKITEVKHKPNGEVQQFLCEALCVSPEEKAVIEYVTQIPSSGRTVITTAFYWQDRNYLVWRMTTPEGKVFGHRFDVCKNVTITADRIDWWDLALDLWVDAQGETQFLDEDEVADYVDRGVFDQEDLHIIARTRVYLSQNYRRLMEDAARWKAPAGAKEPTA